MMGLVGWGIWSGLGVWGGVRMGVPFRFPDVRFLWGGKEKSAYTMRRAKWSLG